LIPNAETNATHCISAMDAGDASTESLGNSVASVVPVASLEIRIDGEITDERTRDIVEALAITMGVSADKMRSTDGGPPQLVCAGHCCDDLATGASKECQCGDVDPEVDSSGQSSDPFDICAEAFASTTGRRNLQMIDDVLLTAQNFTRQLQEEIQRNWKLEFVIEDEPLAQVAIDTLSANSDEALSGIPGAGISTTESMTVCTKGKVRAGANILCQACPFPDFTVDSELCQRCPEGQAPTDRGDDCRCSDGWYNSSRGYVTCHDEGSSVDEYYDVPAALFARQGTVIDEDDDTYGNQCSKCPGDCASCQDGIIRVAPGYALNPRQAAEQKPLDVLNGMRHVFKCVGNHSGTKEAAQCMGETEYQWDGLNPDVHTREEFMYSSCDSAVEQCDKNVWWLCGADDEGCVDTPKLWCGPGYQGALCSNCKEGFGRGGIDREQSCEPCDWLFAGFENAFFTTAFVIGAFLLHYIIGWFAVSEDDLAPVKARIGIALVIANGDYGTPHEGWPWVEYAETDAKAIVSKLKLYGYDVVHVVNGTKTDIEQATELFSQKLLNETKYQQYKQTAPGLAPGEVAALIVYIGHGCQTDGQNCLVPVDHTEGRDEKLVSVADLMAAARPEQRKGPTICFFDANHVVDRGPMVPMQDGTKKDMYRCPLSKVVMSDPVMLKEDPCESEQRLLNTAKAGKKSENTPDRGWCYEKSAILDYCRAIKKANGSDAVVGNPRTGDPMECTYDAANDLVTLELSPNPTKAEHSCLRSTKRSRSHCKPWAGHVGDLRCKSEPLFCEHTRRRLDGIPPRASWAAVPCVSTQSQHASEDASRCR